MNQMEQHSRWMVFASTAIRLPALLFFAVAADLPHVPVLTLLLLALAGVSRNGWRVTDRTVTYSIIVALILTAFGNYLVPIRMERFGFMAYFLRPGIVVPFLFYAAALSVGFRRKGHCVGIAAAAALMAFLVGGDLRRNGPEADRLALDLLLTHHFRLFYGITFGCSAVAALLASRAGRGRPRGKHLFFLAVSLVLTAGIFFGFLLLYRQYEQSIRSWENALLRMGIRQLYRNRPTRHPHQLGGTPELYRPFPPEQRKAAAEVALRAIAPGPPGYLRLNVFSRYGRGTWHDSGDSGRVALEPAAAENWMAADEFYAVTSEKREGERIRIFPAAPLVDSRLAAPGNVTGVEVIANQVSRGADGQLGSEGMIRDGGYTLLVPRIVLRAAWQEPGPPGEEYREIPRRLRRVLRAVSQEIGLADAKSDAERFERAVGFFRKNFRYSLEWPGSPYRTDPVAYFLRSHREGHCELFAGALALLLRECGIPTRYVSGLVCFEEHPSKLYYIARIGNAHAWTEAYDRDRGVWVLLDATPAGTVDPPPPPDDWLGSLARNADLFAFSWSKLLADLRCGRIAAAIVDAAEAFGGGVVFLFLHPVIGPVLVLLIAVLLYRWQKRRRRNTRLTPERRRIQEEFLRRCRTLQKRGLLSPGAEPTAQELLQQLEHDTRLAPEEREELRRFLRNYLIARYRP